MKHIKLILIVFATIFVQNNGYAQIRVKIGDLYYNISGSTASVTSDRSFYSEDDIFVKYISNYRNEEYVIPSSVNYNGYDYPVVAIEEGAFSDQTKYKPSGISSYNLIKENPSPLKHITFPNTITRIGAYAFYYRFLKECTLPNVQIIEKRAFLGAEFASITAPNLKETGEYAFAYNEQLTDINLPKLEILGPHSFGACINLTSFTAPRLISIEDGAFWGCTNLTTIKLEKTESIGSRAFRSCPKLTSVIFPESLNSMGWEVFEDCALLRELIYLSRTPPTDWVATTKTYVPDIQAYTSPTNTINNGEVLEMISFSHNNFNYTGQSPAITWTNNVSRYDASLSLIDINKNAGSYEKWIPVTFTKDGEAFMANVAYRYTINGIPLIAKVESAQREYGDENPTFTVSYSGFVNGEDKNVFEIEPAATTTATKISDIGEYPITIKGGSAKNYIFSYEPGTLTINKAPLSAKVNDVTKEYGMTNPTITISYTGLKNGETEPKWQYALKTRTAATNLSSVGTYAIIAVGTPLNYDLPSIREGTLTITKAPLTIKANDATRQYFEDEPDFEFSCTGFRNIDDVKVLTVVPTFSTEATKTSSVGKYKITPSGAEAMNYAISYEPGELTITKRSLTATSHCSRQYGEENPLLPIEYTGFVNNENENVLTTKPVGTTTATKTSAVGDYPITLSGGEATNYDFTYEQGVLMVTKASLSAKVSDATKVYGSQNPTFSIEYFGLKNGETVPKWTTQPTFQTEATKASGVGQYAVKAVNGVAVNYNLEIGDGTLTVTPAALTIRANNASKVYYEDNPTFGYRCSGFVNGDSESVLTTTPALTTTATKTSNVGAYDINVGETSSPNYSISYVNGTLTINPRTLRASVGNYERIYNEENPAFEVNYSGFVGNDDESVLREKATASTTATKTSDVGTYIISVTGGSADNYTLSYTSGTLTINKAEQTIAWEQELKGLKVGDQVELKAVSSSGLPVTYRMETNNYAEIYSVGTKYYLDCMADGEAQIVAVQEGNRNYYSSPRIRKSVYIGHATEIDAIDNLSVTISSTSFGIRVSNVNMGDVIKVYSADGVLHKSVRADAKTIDIPLTKGYMYIVKVGTKTMKLFY